MPWTCSELRNVSRSGSSPVELLPKHSGIVVKPNALAKRTARRRLVVMTFTPGRELGAETMMELDSGCLGSRRDGYRVTASGERF